MPSVSFRWNQSSQQADNMATQSAASYDPYQSLQQENSMNESPADIESHYKVLGITSHTSLNEVDEKYFELTSIWGGPNHPGSQNFAAEQLRVIDEAYKAILPTLIELESNDENQRKQTMKSISTAQDRILRASIDQDNFWIYADVPPRPLEARQNSPSEDVPPGDSLSQGEELAEQLPNFSKPAPSFSVKEIWGVDLLKTPDRALIVHAVNCQGIWGSGVALKLKTEFPAAYKKYQAYCKMMKKPADLVGKCLLIPPQIKDYMQQHVTDMRALPSARTNNELSKGGAVFKPRKWIACLFTSLGYGRKNMRTNNPGKDSPTKILKQTREALESLRVYLEEFGVTNFDEETSWKTDDDIPGEIWACKFNSGAFGVDWAKSRKVLEEEFAGFERPFHVTHNSCQTTFESDEAVEDEASQDLSSK